ncbi:MAG TPA: CRTAC1 family protein, partial [Gammaproteobacteria bacterium]|nr:CRTAC1 family protein [Gammaproteobacteria bacterium]
YGATVSATVGSIRMNRDVQPSASYVASSDPRVHFGLGASTTVKNVSVRWPGGKIETFGDFTAGTIYTLREGAGHQD